MDSIGGLMAIRATNRDGNTEKQNSPVSPGGWTGHHCGPYHSLSSSRDALQPFQDDRLERTRGDDANSAFENIGLYNSRGNASARKRSAGNPHRGVSASGRFDVPLIMQAEIWYFGANAGRVGLSWRKDLSYTAMALS